jgi:hypothetical protein
VYMLVGVTGELIILRRLYIAKRRSIKLIGAAMKHPSVPVDRKYIEWTALVVTFSSIWVFVINGGVEATTSRSSWVLV